MDGTLHLVTAPAFEPVSRAEAKLHLRIDTTADDALIDGLILAARQHAETVTQRALVAQTWDDKRPRFPWNTYWGNIWLPKPPISSVTSVTYLDSNGTSQTWDSANYVTDLPAGPWARKGRIYPAYSASYPSTRAIPNAVTIRFVAGYGGQTTKTISGITRSSSTATLTTSAVHGWTAGQRVTIKGSNQDDYNGTFELLTIPAPTTATFAVKNDPTTPATGTMTGAVLDVPSGIVSAMKILIAHWYYEGRQPVVVGTSAQNIPMTVDALLWPYKVWTWP